MPAAPEHRRSRARPNRARSDRLQPSGRAEPDRAGRDHVKPDDAAPDHGDADRADSSRHVPTPPEPHDDTRHRSPTPPAAPADIDPVPAAPDVSERAERTRRAGRSAGGRAQRIDETLTRLTAAHAGLAPARTDGDEDKGPRRRARPTVGRILILALVALVVSTTTFGWAAKGWLGSAVRAVGALDPQSGAIVDAAGQWGDENVLVVTTSRAPGLPTGTPDAPASSSDTVVVAHVPEGGGPVVALAVPANLEINRPPCERFDPVSATYTDETVPAQARTQLATAMAVGGPRCTTRVVQQLTGLAITKFVGVDLDHMGAAIDAVAGVEVCVTQPVLDAVLGPVVPDAGLTRLDGMHAGDYIRAADVRDDAPSDYARIERQQQVFAALLDAALSGTALLDVRRLTALRPALRAAVVSDGAGLDEMLAVAHSLRSLDADGVTFATVPTAPDANGRGTAVLREADAAALFAALREDRPPPAGNREQATLGPSPADVSVQVLNASDRAGLAAQVGETLHGLGFVVAEAANADQPSPQTMIRFSPDQTAAAGLLAATVPSALSVPDPGTAGVLQLVLGRSFDGVVRAPAEPVASPGPAPGSARAPGAGCP